MNRQEAISNLASAMDLINGLDHVLWESIEALVTDASPDPITGLMPCGCGRKVDVAFYPSWRGVPDRYHVDCFYCHVGTRPCQTAEQAKAAWNTAMGWKGGVK